MLFKTWLVYILVLIGFGILNRIKPGSISSLGFYVVLSIPFVSLIHMIYTYSFFKLIHDVDRREVSKGEAIVYTIKLVNPSILMFAPFYLHFIASDKLFLSLKDEEHQQIIVGEQKRVVIKKSLNCSYRGNYTVGVDRIIIKDFLNFFQFTYKVDEQHKILVYPKLRELRSNVLKNVANESNESVVSNNSQNESVFSDIREYIPGDALNRIHWKLTAKAGKWLTKDMSGQMTNKTKVFLDTFHLELPEEDQIVFEDYLVEGCVSILHFLLENRIHTELYYEHFGIQHIEGFSQNEFPRMYDALAHLSFYHEKKLVEMLENVFLHTQDTCHLIVLTQQLNIPLASALIRLKYRNFEITLITCDTSNLEIENIEKYHDNQSQLMLLTSKIPIYYMQHDESSTRLGVM